MFKIKSAHFSIYTSHIDKYGKMQWDSDENAVVEAYILTM